MKDAWQVGTWRLIMGDGMPLGRYQTSGEIIGDGGDGLFPIWTVEEYHRKTTRYRESLFGRVRIFQKSKLVRKTSKLVN